MDVKLVFSRTRPPSLEDFLKIGEKGFAVQFEPAPNRKVEPASIAGIPWVEPAEPSPRPSFVRERCGIFVRDPNIMYGQWVLQGTRLTFAYMYGILRKGETLFRQCFPTDNLGSKHTTDSVIQEITRLMPTKRRRQLKLIAHIAKGKLPVAFGTRSRKNRETESKKRKN